MGSWWQEFFKRLFNSIRYVCSTSDYVRLPNVDDDEKNYGQIDQDTNSNGAKNAAYNIKA